MIQKWVISTIAALNANNRPGEVAAAITLGLTLGFIPANNLIWFMLLAITFFLKINFGAQMVVIAIIKIFARFFDPLFDMAGYKILTAEPLQSLFTQWYNMPIVPFSGFNNTVVAGSIAVMLILAVPLWFLFKKLIILYRTKIRDRILSSTIIKKIKNLPVISKIINFFVTMHELRN